MDDDDFNNDPLRDPRRQGYFNSILDEGDLDPLDDVISEDDGEED